MKCPGCNESNDAGMQFCIYCGHGLSSSTPTPTPQIAPAVQLHDDLQALSRPMGNSQMMVLICTVCNKTDPLNGQFCVFCAGRTIAGSAATQMPAHMNFGTSQASLTSQTVQPDLRNLSEELARTPISSQNKAQKPGNSNFVLWVILAVILGSSAGLGTVYMIKEDVQKGSLASSWPNEGLLVFSSAQNANARIEDSKQKTLIFGKTSSKGTLYIPDIEAGTYQLKLSDGNSKETTQDINVSQGAQSIVGYPSRLEIK